MNSYFSVSKVGSWKLKHKLFKNNSGYWLAINVNDTMALDWSDLLINVEVQLRNGEESSCKTLGHWSPVTSDLSSHT